jgi:hypothetical protein
MGKAEYESQTVAKLQDELVARQLDTNGNKADLVARLVEADRQEAEGQTVEELKDELRDQDQPVSGTKDELVDRLVGDEDEFKDKPKRREIHAGGHVILADVEPPTPDPIDRCSVCGASYGECDHTNQDVENPTGWSTEEGA